MTLPATMKAPMPASPVRTAFGRIVSRTILSIVNGLKEVEDNSEKR